LELVLILRDPVGRVGQYHVNVAFVQQLPQTLEARRVDGGAAGGVSDVFDDAPGVVQSPAPAMPFLGDTTK